MLSRTSWTSVSMAALALGLLAVPAPGQLRPLDPIDWTSLRATTSTVVVGGGFFDGQRASLAGTKGWLVEAGSFTATWSFDRVAVSLAGTLLRVFEDETVFAEPVADARAPDGTSRTDAGDFRVSTIVHLTAPESRVSAALRFGVRLPTTDNVKGLGRDQTDFFSTIAGRIVDGRWTVAIEGGMGVNGTRDTHNEQIDPILFAGSAIYDAGTIDPLLELTGQHDPRSDRDRRGNENLGEVRVGFRAGAERWISVTAIRGWTPFSPDFGLSVQFGTRF